MGSGQSLLTKVPNVPVELIIDGLFLHFDGMSAELRSKLDARLEVEMGIRDEGATTFDYSTIVGKSKVDYHVFDDFQHHFGTTIRHKHLLPRDYKFFGTGNLRKNLRYFLRYNAFFTPAVSVYRDAQGKRYWAIKTLDPDHHTLYSKVAAAYDPTFPRVNVILDEETLDLASYSVFVNGEDRTEDLDEAHVLRYLFVTLCYFAEVVHALIHIYDLILTTALLHATQHDDVQSLWAQQFAENTNLQYLEAKLLLFSAEGDTNSVGFHSQSDILRPVAKDMLTQWLRYHSADDVLRLFLLSGIRATGTEQDMNEAQHGPLFIAEWRKHATLLPQYAHDLQFVFTRRKPHCVETTDGNLKAYMHRVGDHVSTIDSLASWVELMGAFALLHGNTLSMTRLLMTPNIFRYLGTAKESTEYTTKDADFLSSIHRTISGLEPGRYFFSGSTLGKVIAHPLLKCIMNKFDGLVSMMEMEYYMKLWENPEEFADFGWIMTDYCPDGIDGKQITLNTYV
jgi:hypothetical protein